MTDFMAYLKRGAKETDVLAGAGMKHEAIASNRHFITRWAWDDGHTAIVTIWVDEIQDPHGVPKWSQTNPRLRDDLSGSARSSALELFNNLIRSVDEPVRVILLKAKPDRKKWASGKAEARGVDPEPWFSIIEGDSVILQRGSPPGRRDISVTGTPMSPREPGFALRETRPDQFRFRQRVAAKTGNRCALTGAPSELCDAAHFPWTDWRTDNEPHHGILLRRDLHAALDCGLMEIDRKGVVVVTEYLASCSDEYRAMHQRQVPSGTE